MGNQLDEELAAVAGIDENDAPEVVQPGAMAVPGSNATDADEKRKPPLAMLAMLLVMAAGIVALFMFGIDGVAAYSIPLDKLMTEKDQMVDRRVRIEGEMVPGTLRKRDKPCEYRFDIRDKDKKHEVEVRFPQCVVPDAFRDVPEGGVLVTAEGSLAKSGHFEATTIMAKCASKYDPETHTVTPKGPTAAR